MSKDVKYCPAGYYLDEQDYSDDVTNDPTYSYLYCKQLEKGELWINGVITDETIGKINLGLNYLNGKDDVDIIKLYINSRGGSMFPALACTDFIRTIQKPVVTVVTGIAFSGAFFIYMAGDVRLAYPFSAFMIHDQVIEFANGYRGSLHRELHFQDAFNNKMAEFLSDRSKLDLEECRKWVNEEYDIYMNSDLAIAKGVAHKIIEPKTEINLEDVLRKVGNVR